ncbi:MAG: CPBP family glutamic-type intramembrane protease [Erysipelotrichaceae bacterium]|nr:CPBP family glutamic-type intramembrane protease [Erysipelotrichaceae bacterium]
MFCKHCGRQLNDNDVYCPVCGTKVVDYAYNEKTIKETIKESIRNQAGYVDLKSKWWHHLLVAAVGYIAMYILSSIILSVMVIVYQNMGYDFSCYLDETISCPIEVENAYLFISSLSQILAEIIVIVSVMIIYRKYLKHFFNQLRSGNTWKWLGICLAGVYLANLMYSQILDLFGYTDTSNANQDIVSSIIINTPLLGFTFVVIAAPVFEEIIFRFGIFRSFVNGNKKREIIGLIITTLLFALIHMVATVQEALSVTDGTGLSIFLNDLVTLPIYLIGAFCLTFAYYKSKNLATCITMHMIYNFISYISIIAMSANIG